MAPGTLLGALLLLLHAGTSHTLALPDVTSLTNISALEETSGDVCPMECDCYELIYCRKSSKIPRLPSRGGDNGNLTVNSLTFHEGSFSDIPARHLEHLDSLIDLVVVNHTAKLRLDPDTFVGVDDTLKWVSLPNVPLEGGRFPKGLFTDVMRRRLEGILLQNNGIQDVDTLTEIGSGWQRLLTLVIEGNRVGPALAPGAFDGMGPLQALTLSNCGIVSLSPGVFERLSTLLYLNLEKNAITDLPPGALVQLGALSWLGLEFNMIETLAPDVFMSQTSLERLSMKGNRLTVVPKNVFSPVLHTVKSISLADNALDCRLLRRLNETLTELWDARPTWLDEKEKPSGSFPSEEFAWRNEQLGADLDEDTCVRYDVAQCGVTSALVSVDIGSSVVASCPGAGGQLSTPPAECVRLGCCFIFSNGEEDAGEQGFCGTLKGRISSAVTKGGDGEKVCSRSLVTDDPGWCEALGCFHVAVGFGLHLCFAQDTLSAALAN